MQRYAGSCSPAQLLTFQKVFDLVWMELRANGSSNYTGPNDPDDLRQEIARRVLAYDDALETDVISRLVLSSFGVPTDALERQPTIGNGAGKPSAAK